MFNVNVLIWIVISPLPFKVQEGNALPMTGYYDYTISIYGTLSIIVPLIKCVCFCCFENTPRLCVCV